MLPQGQDRPVGGAAGSFKAAIGPAAQRQKAMQKIVSGVGIRFDVVEQHPRGIAELGQGVGVAGLQRLGDAVLLNFGLSDQLDGQLRLLDAALV